MPMVRDRDLLGTVLYRARHNKYVRKNELVRLIADNLGVTQLNMYNLGLHNLTKLELICLAEAFEKALSRK